MAMEINLLPGELKPKGYALKLSKTLKKFAFLSLGIFVVTFLLYTASNILLSVQVRNYNSGKEKIEKEIEALKKTELKLVLAQDRLQKIGTILNENDANEEVGITKTVIEKPEAEVKFEGLKISKDQAILNVKTDYSVNLTHFINQLLNSGFNKIEFVSFIYEQGKGYNAEIGISK